jgi:hypothetical protein
MRVSRLHLYPPLASPEAAKSEISPITIGKAQAVHNEKNMDQSDLIQLLSGAPAAGRKAVRQKQP